MVVAAAAAAGRRVTMLGAPRGAGVDQPLDPAYLEGNYLTALYKSVASREGDGWRTKRGGWRTKRDKMRGREEGVVVSCAMTRVL